ncbi:MAG: hypothetical protein CMK09_15835 [Ponticaulis sp.]|nr:hypothetical protein [Ponticaulis sp.]
MTPLNAPADCWAQRAVFSMVRANASIEFMLDKLQAYGCGLHAAQDLIAGARQTRCRRLWLALRRFLTRDEALDALTSGGSEAVMFMGGRKRVLAHARHVARVYRRFDHV